MSQEFEDRSREILEESTARLDGRTLSRLTQARHAALARSIQAGRPGWRRWMPAGAVAAAAVLAVMLWTHPTTERGPAIANVSGSPFEDIDLLVDAPEFVGDADDVEFYEWAAGEIES